MKLRSCLFLFAFSFPLWAQSQKEEIQSIDQKIQLLEQRLQETRLEEMRDKVEGQDYMISDWKSYGEEVEQLKNQNQAGKNIEKQVEMLKQQKQELLNAPNRGL
jgi:hypothetical protein